MFTWENICIQYKQYVQQSNYFGIDKLGRLERELRKAGIGVERKSVRASEKNREETTDEKRVLKMEQIESTMVNILVNKTM